MKGHTANVYKDYDVLRCVHCDEIIKVPHEAFIFECPHCDGLNEFTEEAANDG